jgi:hypothetical protein
MSSTSSFAWHSFHKPDLQGPAALMQLVIACAYAYTYAAMLLYKKTTEVNFKSDHSARAAPQPWQRWKKNGNFEV